MTAFGSASLDVNIALGFALPVPGRIPCLIEVNISNEYNTKEEHKVTYEQAFAKIASLSTMQGEQEVLFSLGTQFRVQHIGSPISREGQPWVPIILELVRDRTQQHDSIHFRVVEAVPQLDAQSYHDILSMLQIMAKDEQRFNGTNWARWWSNVVKRVFVDRKHKVPLLITFYRSFTEDKAWLRKAVDLHINILRSPIYTESKASLFASLFSGAHTRDLDPTRCIAIYETYLQELLAVDSKQRIEQLLHVGKIYEQIVDYERALQCYESAKMLVSDAAQLSKIQKRLEKLSKSSIPTKRIDKVTPVAPKGIDEEFSNIYDVQHHEYSTYWRLKRIGDENPSINQILSQLNKYLEQREAWYAESDLKILLRIPPGNQSGLPLETYWHYF